MVPLIELLRYLDREADTQQVYQKGSLMKMIAADFDSFSNVNEKLMNFYDCKIEPYVREYNQEAIMKLDTQFKDFKADFDRVKYLSDITEAKIISNY